MYLWFGDHSLSALPSRLPLVAPSLQSQLIHWLGLRRRLEAPHPQFSESQILPLWGGAPAFYYVLFLAQTLFGWTQWLGQWHSAATLPPRRQLTVGGHFQPWVWERSVTGISHDDRVMRVEIRDAAKCLTVYRTAPPNKQWSGLNVSIAKVKKPWIRIRKLTSLSSRLPNVLPN